MPTLAEDVLLICHANGGATFVDGSTLDVVLAGATMVELSRSGRVVADRLLGRGQSVVRVANHASAPTSTGDALQDTMLRLLARWGPSEVHAALARTPGWHAWLRDEMTASGALVRSRKNVFTPVRWQTADRHHAVDLWARMTDCVAVGGRTDDEHAVALTRLLAPTGYLPSAGLSTARKAAVVRFLVQSDAVASGIDRVLEMRREAAADAGAVLLIAG